MNRSRPSLLLLPLLLLAGLAAFSQPRVDSPTPPDEEAAIVEHMETLSGAMKRLRRTVGDERKRPEALGLLNQVQLSAVAAKGELPPMAADQPEAERAAFVGDFRKMMVEMLSRSLELELALIEGEQQKIDAAYKQLRAMEDKGHERFTEDG